MKKLFATLLLSAVIGTGAWAQDDIPLVYKVENTGSAASPVLPAKDQAKKVDPLPDPFEWSDGSGRVNSFSDWSQRRGEIAKEIQHYEIGTKPTVNPEDVKAEMDGNTLKVAVTVNGQTLNLSATITYPSVGEAPYALMIGTSGISLPSQLFKNRPIAMMTFSESQVNNYSQFGSPAGRGNYAFDKLYPDLKDNGAYSEWAWGLSRLIDGLQQLGSEVTKIDTERIGVTGCSYAGKMALFCGAFDERVALTIAQEPGGGGAAAWRYSRWHNAQPDAETVEGLDNTDYNWFMESLKANYSGKDVSYLPHDHHELAAMVCPRALLMLGNPDFVWLADPSGYVSMNGAVKVWEQFGIEDRVGYSIVPGHGHCQLPESQYPEVEAYLDKFLLGNQDVDTKVRIAPDSYKNIDLDWWIGWWGNSEPQEFSADPVVYQGPAAGTESSLPLVGNWSSRVSGEAADDGKIYSGTVNFSGQWGEVGGKIWGSDVTEGTRHVITVTTSNPIPEGLQWKIGYKDIYGEPAAEQYYPIEAGGTEIQFELTQSHWYAAVQRKSNTSISPLEIVSVKRDVYLTDFTPTEEDLAIKVGSGAEIEGHVVSANGLPATVALPGNWGDVKLWKEPFSITDYPRYRVELGVEPEDRQVQIFIRNAAQAAEYGGHYYEFAAGKTVMEGEFKESDLGDDLVVTQFALQNMTSNTVETIVKDVTLYTPDGTPVPTKGLKADGTPEEGTFHRYTFFTDAPIPADFQTVIVLKDNSETIITPVASGNNGEVQAKPVSASTYEYHVDILKPYTFFALQYKNEEQASISVNKIKREVLAIDPTGIVAPETDNGMAQVEKRQVFTTSGQAVQQMRQGIYLLRETRADGKVTTRKVMRK